MATETAKKSSFEANSAGFSSPSKSQKSFFMAQIMVRILAITFTVAAISVLVSANQTVLLFGSSIKARYCNTSAFKFLLGADAVVFAFSVLSLIFVCLLSRSGSKPFNYLFLFLHDMVMLVMMVSGCAAATAVGYVGHFGEADVGWGAVCDFVGKFCRQTLISLVMSYLAFFCYLALNTLAAHKLYVSSY